MPGIFMSPNGGEDCVFSLKTTKSFYKKISEPKFLLSNQFKGLPGVENAGPALEGALQKNSGHAILWKTGETCLDLAQAGVKVICCEREDVPAPLGFASKYTAWTVTLPAEGYLEALHDLCAQVSREEGENPALLPMGAATLALLSENRAKFDPVCGLLIPSPGQLDTFNSKASVAALGEELGVPVPRQFAAAEGESLPDFFARVPLPCVVKPLCGEKFGLSAAQRYIIAQTPEVGRVAYERFLSLAGEAPRGRVGLFGAGGRGDRPGRPLPSAFAGISRLRRALGLLCPGGPARLGGLCRSAGGQGRLFRPCHV